MKRTLFALALLLAPQALAQTTQIATKAEIEAFIRLHNKALSDLKSVLPAVTWPTNGDSAAFLEACRTARAGVDVGLPRAQMITDALQSAPPLATTGDVDRDHSFQTTHTELINSIDYLKTALTQVSSLCLAAEQGNMEKAYGAASVMVDAIIKVQDSGSIAIRAAKGDPGPPAFKAAVEGLALSMDGLGVIARYSFGKIDHATAAAQFAELAPQLRIQANLIRDGYAVRPSSAGAAYGEKVAAARASMPEKLEQASALFEATSAKLAADTFTSTDYANYLAAIRSIGIGKTYDAAWALQ